MEAPRHAPDPSSASARIEAIIAVAGAVLLLATLGYLLYRALFDDARAPDIRVRVEAVAAAGPAHRIDIEIANRGTRGASNVTVTGELSRGGEALETARLMLDDLPANTVRRGSLTFAHDPASARLALRAESYAVP